MKKIASYIAISCCCVAAIALMVATFELQRVYTREHDRSMAELSARKISVENYARKQFILKSESKMAEAIEVITESLDDPYLESSDRFWWYDGKLKLPKLPLQLSGSSKGSQVSLQTSYNDILGFIESSHSPFKERLSPNQVEQLKSLQLFMNTVAKNQRGNIPRLVRNILPYLNYDADVQPLSLAFYLVFIESFADYPFASPDLLEKLFAKDLIDRNGNRLLSLQTQLLLSRSTLTQADINFVKKRIDALCLSLAQDCDAFYEVLNIEINLPNDLASVSELGDGLYLFNSEWLINKDGASTFGILIQPTTLIDAISREMNAIGLTAESDIITADFRSPKALGNITINWQSPNWQQTLNDLQRFNQIKYTILSATFFIIIGLGAALWWLYKTQLRWVNVKSEFIATVSHELRTPLSSIRLMAERLSTLVADNTKAKDYPQRIIQDIDTLSFLADNILSFERLQSGKWVAHKSPLRLSEVFFKLEQELLLHTSKPFALTTEGNTNISIYADPVLMQLLFLNLAKNSCAYNNQPTVSINIRWTVVSGKVVIDFTDNGSGISQPDAGAVFEPFFRGKEQKHSRGSGLGLALCKRIAKLHSGDIQITQSSKEGTCFRIEFGEYQADE